MTTSTPIFSRPLYDCVKIVHLEARQDSVSVWLDITIADRYFRTLPNRSSSPAAADTIAAACLHVGDGK
jgi:hypothetical protein